MVRREPAGGGRLDDYRIIIRKAARRLDLFEVRGGAIRLRKSYRIAPGHNPRGHKREQGDGATPEGEYYITHKNPRSRFHLSLGLSYPNLAEPRGSSAG